jgi:parallel beta-helix repeat protein
MSSGLAKGLIYPITSNTTTVLTYTGTQSADFTETVSGSGNSRLVCSNSTSLITANNQLIGRYVQDKTSSAYFLISTSTNADAACGSSYDSFTVVASPGAFASLANGHNANISDGVQAGDHYEVEQLAHMTAKSGTACSSGNSHTYDPYYYAKSGSETVIQYAEACNLGRNADISGYTQYGLYFYEVNGANANEGMTIDRLWSHNNYRGAYIYYDLNNNTTNSKGITNSAFNSNASQGFCIVDSKSDTISSSTFYGNPNEAIQVVTSGNVTVTSNTISGNDTFGYGSVEIYYGSNNTITSNIIKSDPGSGAYGGITIYLSNNNTVTSNTSIGNTAGILIFQNSANNIFNSNTFYSNTCGIYFSGSNNNILMNNSSYNNIYYGLYTYQSTNNISINDNYGGSGANTTADIDLAWHNAEIMTLYTTILSSQTKVYQSYGPVEGAYSQYVIS